MTLYRVSNFSLGKQKESEVLKVCIKFNLKIFSEGVSHQKLGFWGLYYPFSQQSEKNWSFWGVHEPQSQQTECKVLKVLSTSIQIERKWGS